MNATSMSVRSALIAACASAALSQKERSAPMTPTNPITEAREALEKENERWYSGLSVIDNANTPLRLEAIDAALSIAQTQAAEIERLYKSCADWEKALEASEAEIAHWNKRFDELANENTTLKAKLAKAEEVIKPLYFDSTNIPHAWPDRRPLWVRADNGKYAELLHTTVGTLRSAAQFTKGEEG